VPSDQEAVLVKRLRADHPADVVLVVGHSNSVPALLKALGCTDAPAIADDDYGNVFVLIPRPGAPPVLLRLRY